MAPPPKERLRVLTDEERATLTRVSRATALMAVADGATFAGAVRRAGFRSSTAVADLVAQFNQRGLGALTIAPGRGPKAAYDTAARAQIVAAAQRPPDRRADATAGPTASRRRAASSSCASPASC